MVSEKYKKELIKNCKVLDSLSNEIFSFEKLLNEIVFEENDKAILEFIKNLGILTKKQMIVDMEQKQIELIEILYKFLGALKTEMIIQDFKDISIVTLEESLNKLENLVGLRDVKSKVNNLIRYNEIQKIREENGLKISNKILHMAFLGNPGTAKTTVARIVGKMYKSIGLLSKGHFIEASRTDLIAEYQGQTAIKVKRLINRARGGVLFIDEAYSITENNNSDSYGKESLTELTKALEDYRDDLVVIVAGYPDLMNEFFNSNPGIKSRFNTFIIFEDYCLEELIDIFKYICDQNDYKIENNAIEKIKYLLKNKLEEQDKYFSNGRFMRNLFDDIIMNQSQRLYNNKNEITKLELILIIDEDIPSVI